MAETQRTKTREELVKEIDEKWEKRFKELEESTASRIDKLKAHYEKRDEMAKLDQSPTKPNIKVYQNRPMGPIDHMGTLAEKHKDKLKGKHIRFVNKHETVMPVRAAQGYEKVKDENGNEVRYMDEVLMAMPERKYQETVKAEVEDRKARHRGAIQETFHEAGKEYGVETFGTGIDYDEKA